MDARNRSIARHLTPFILVAVLGLVVVGAALDVSPTQYWLAVGLTIVSFTLILTIPWLAAPDWVGAIPALIYLAAVGLLRDSAGGAVIGIGPLVLLPVLWIGLYGTRRQMAIVLPAIGAAFFVPIILVGEPGYPARQWYAGVIYVAISLLIGPNVQRLIGKVRSQADDAQRRQRELASVAEVARKLSTGGGTRRDVCAAASQLGGSSFSLLWEPDPDDRLVCTAAAGVEAPTLVIDPAKERTGAATAFRTAAPLFSPDAHRDPSVSKRLLAILPDTRSILFQPVIHRGDPTGVLVLGWEERVDHHEDRLRVMAGLLAAEAAIAIERADLLTKLEQLADTDELTGLPNRRAWNRELEVALSTAERRGTPVCAALIDLDHFKDLNDANGHQAGDRVLKAAAAEWRSTLRPADILARPGGDEFTLVLPDCDLDGAGAVLDRLRQATPHGSTCSIGVAEWDAGETAESLLERADGALYAAKEAGRDRVVLALEASA